MRLFCQRCSLLITYDWPGCQIEIRAATTESPAPLTLMGYLPTSAQKAASRSASSSSNDTLIGRKSRLYIGICQ